MELRKDAFKGDSDRVPERRSGLRAGRGNVRAEYLYNKNAPHYLEKSMYCDAPSVFCWRPQADKNYINNILILNYFYKYFFFDTY